MIFEFSSFSFFSSTEKLSFPASVHLYQQKVGSILFAAITIRSDVTFAVSRLRQRNAAFIFQDHAAVDRVIQYLQYTRSLAIQFDVQETKEAIAAFICVSDASFADNPDRKSSQGYCWFKFRSERAGSITHARLIGSDLKPHVASS